MQYLRNEKYFLFFWHFGNLYVIFEHFQINMTLIADVFFNIPTQKDVVG